MTAAGTGSIFSWEPDLPSQTPDIISFGLSRVCNCTLLTFGGITALSHAGLVLNSLTLEVNIALGGLEAPKLSVREGKLSSKILGRDSLTVDFKSGCSVSLLGSFSSSFTRPVAL